MSRAGGIPYPERYLGRWLERAVQRKIDDDSELDSAAAISRWLGHDEPTRFNKWVKGRLLPKEEDYRPLSRLGLSVAEIHKLVVKDRMSALAHDEKLDDAALLETAADIARAGGMSTEELIRLLLETDLEALERALESS